MNMMNNEIYKWSMYKSELDNQTLNHN